MFLTKRVSSHRSPCCSNGATMRINYSIAYCPVSHPFVSMSDSSKCCNELPSPTCSSMTDCRMQLTKGSGSMIKMCHVTKLTEQVYGPIYGARIILQQCNEVSDLWIDYNEGQKYHTCVNFLNYSNEKLEQILERMNFIHSQTVNHS